MSGIEAVPAPWLLKARTWIFNLSALSTTTSFPAGFSAPNEAEALTSGGEFIGGSGLVQLVSYSESPVGPYDELIYSPGRWKYANGKTGFRVTRIYVSTKESTENGRRNWNIPKHVANFDIRTDSDGTTNFAVTHPDASSPFFQASASPISIFSALWIPFTTTILGSFFSLVQPPLPAGDQPEEVGTSQWAALTPVMKGSLHVVRVTAGLNGKVGDGAGFPAVVPWSVGTAWENVELNFGVPTLLDTV